MSTSEESPIEQIATLNAENERLSSENESLQSQLISSLALLTQAQEDQRAAAYFCLDGGLPFERWLDARSIVEISMRPAPSMIGEAEDAPMGWIVEGNGQRIDPPAPGSYPSQEAARAAMRLLVKELETIRSGRSATRDESMLQAMPAPTHTVCPSSSP